MKTRIIITWAIFACLVLSFVNASPVNAANTTEQILTQIDDILKANPLSATDKVQMINVVQDDTITINVARFIEGAEVKPPGRQQQRLCPGQRNRLAGLGGGRPRPAGLDAASHRHPEHPSGPARRPVPDRRRHGCQPAAGCSLAAARWRCHAARRLAGAAG